MTPKEIAHARSRLAEAHEREQRFGRMALQDGITPEQRWAYRQLQLSARAEAKLAEKELGNVG